MSYPSIFVDGSVLFSKYGYLDLTLLDCSRCEYVNNNIYKLEFLIENKEKTFLPFSGKHVHTYVRTDYSHMVGKKITKFQKYDL